MKSLEEIFDPGNTPDTIIGILSSQAKDCVPWSSIEKDFNPKKHDIIADATRRPKVRTKGGRKEVPAKLSYPAEMIATRRMTQMAFAIPVKRKYTRPVDDGEKEFQKAIENVYESVRINGVNSKRFYAYFGACEVCTFWYIVDCPPHNRYGFTSSHKLRCRSFSPMSSVFSRVRQAEIYPYFDDMDDLIVLSVRYKDADGVERFDAYTTDVVYYYVREKSEWLVEEKENPLGKIPASYISRPLPVAYGISDNRDDIEFTLSRDSDILRDNSSPIVKVKGKVRGEKPIGDTTRQVYELENGGDMDLISPALTTNDAKTHVGMLKQINEEILQLPDLSMENIKEIGAQSGEARKTLLTDPHLRVMDERHDIVWFLDREFEVIKSFLCIERPDWEKYRHTTQCEQVITPFIQNDRKADIDDFSKASGTLVSQRSAIAQADLVDDPDAEYEQILEEKKEAAKAERMQDVFTGAE